MTHPFVVGPPVRGRHLCGRDVELRRIASALASGARAAVTGAPGAGLTSMALELADRLGSADRPVVRLQAAEVEDADEAFRLFERATAALPDGGEGRFHLLLDGLRREAPAEAVRPLLRETSDRRVGTLLLGSPRFVPGLMEDTAAFDDGERPTISLELSPPPESAWLAYVLERFLETDRWIGNEHVRRVLEATGGLPRPTQAVMHALWDLTEEGGRVEDGAVDRALRSAVEREGAGYRLLMDGLTGNQRRVLRGLARRPEPAPYSGAFVASQGLASPSSVQRALEALEDRRLVRRRRGEPPRPADPLMARWLRLQEEEGVAVGKGVR